MNKKRVKWPFYLTLGVVACLVLAYFISPDYREFIREAYQTLRSGELDRISRWVREFGWRGPLVIVLAMVLQMFLVVVPSWLLMIVSVVSLGPVRGTAVAILAVGVASSVGFVIGKQLSTYTVDRLIGRRSRDKLSDYLQKYGFCT